MGAINKPAPRRSTCPCPQPVDPAELRRRIEAGEWVVDLRNRTAFAAGHLAGTLGLRAVATPSSPTSAGSTTGAHPLTLIGRRHRAKSPTPGGNSSASASTTSAGAATGDIHTLGDGTSLRSYPVGDFAELANAIGA